MSRIMSSQYILDRVGQNQRGRNKQENVSNNLSNHSPNSVSLHSQSFEQVYNKIANQGVTLSKHAYQRIKSRNIDLNDAQIKRVSEALEQAKQKGIKDALIMLDNKMMIANVKNNTIVTIANKSDLNDDIITNIDGAIIL